MAATKGKAKRTHTYSNEQEKSVAKNAVVGALEKYSRRLDAPDHSTIRKKLALVINEWELTPYPISRRTVKRAIGSLYGQRRVDIGKLIHPETREEIVRCVLR